MTKSFHAGKAASDGLLSALLAKNGLTSPPNILEGEKGLGSLLSSDFSPQRGLEGLGESYTIMGLSFKPYASCLYTHPAIDATIQLRKEHQLKPEAVKTIQCSVSKFCVDAACHKDPKTGLDAKFSTPYCIAIALLEGRAGEDLFQDERIGDPVIRELMKKVQIEEKGELSDREAEVRIKLCSGKTVEYRVHYPLGCPENSLSNHELEKKARNLLDPIFCQQRVDVILEKLWALESLKSITELTSLLSEEHPKHDV